MYNNVGKTLMTVAKLFCWIGIIACFIIGVTIIATSVNSYGNQVPSGVLIGFSIIIFGSLLSWLGSLGLYGLGQVIEDGAATRKMMEEFKEKQAIAPRRTVQTKPKNFWTCSKCGKINPNSVNTCRNCGTEK